MTNNDNNNDSGIPQNDSSKAMDSKQEVKNSPDEKTDQDFPGYPHYPAKEDIMDKSTGSHRVDADVQEMGTGSNATGVSQRFPSGQEDNGNNEGLDGTNEERGVPQNVSNEELNKKADQPGTDIDEAAEKGSLNP